MAIICTDATSLQTALEHERFKVLYESLAEIRPKAMPLAEEITTAVGHSPRHSLRLPIFRTNYLSQNYLCLPLAVDKFSRKLYTTWTFLAVAQQRRFVLHSSCIRHNRIFLLSII